MFPGSSVALVTPLRADGQLDLPAWQRLLEWHLASGTEGVVVGGTTGESTALTDAELLALVGAAREQIGGRMSLIVGAGTSSTATTLERVRGLSSLGVDGLLVVTPAYVKPTQEGLYRHYAAIAAETRVPLVLYNVPGRTAVDLLPVTVARLAGLGPVVAIKEALASIDRIRELCALAPGLTVLSGDDATAREAIFAGAKGVISVTANVAPQAMRALVDAARAADHGRALAIDETLAGLHSALFLESNPIPVKWALARLGRIDGTLRLPLTTLAAAHRATVESALARAGLLAAQ
ncbi:MAG: 4-hydroxy-tetrahydrodipicolinate synthase [Steroidobacteraceae bacterium]